MTPSDNQTGEEFSEFLFEAKQRADGTVPNDAEEARRKRAIQLHTQHIAAKHGFAVETNSVCPDDPVTPTARHADIAAIAKVVMPKRDVEARTIFESTEIITKDGLCTKKTFVQLGFLDSISNAIRGLLNPIGLTKAVESLSKRVKRVSLRVGPWIHAEADFVDDSASDMVSESKLIGDDLNDAE